MAQLVRRVSHINNQDTSNLVLRRVINAALSILTSLLIIRMILALFGANKSNAFAQFVYALTDPLTRPFLGLFSIEQQLGVARFEIETLVAIVVVALIGWVIHSVFSIGRETVARDDDVVVEDV